MKEDGEFMPATKEQLNIRKIENELPNQHRILASDLHHNKKWLGLLQRYDTVEIISASETIAQLSKPNFIPDLINKIKELEQEIEQLKVEHLYTSRLQDRNRLNGVALEDATNALLDHYLQNGEIK